MISVVWLPQQNDDQKRFQIDKSNNCDQITSSTPFFTETKTKLNRKKPNYFCANKTASLNTKSVCVWLEWRHFHYPITITWYALFVILCTYLCFILFLFFSFFSFYFLLESTCTKRQLLSENCLQTLANHLKLEANGFLHYVLWLSIKIQFFFTEQKKSKEYYLRWMKSKPSSFYRNGSITIRTPHTHRPNGIQRMFNWMKLAARFFLVVDCCKTLHVNVLQTQHKYLMKYIEIVHSHRGTRHFG